MTEQPEKMESNVASTLPPEILEKIFDQLDLEDLLACTEVCVNWYQVADSKRLWKKFASYGDMGILDYELRECDAVTTNFTNKLHGIKTIFPSTLSPMNPVKMFLKQRNFLRSSWIRGAYTLQVLHPTNCLFSRFGEISYPSKAPQDCLYYPILGKQKNGRVDLYLIRLDNKPRIVYKLIENVRVRNGVCEGYPRACVMRDCVVWVCGGKVQCLALTGDLNKSKVQTLATWEISNADFDIYITMDFDHILAVCGKFFHLWCKKTLEVKFSRGGFRGEDGTYHLNGYPYLVDGFLIIPCVYEDRYFNTLLEIHDLINMAKKKLVMNGVCMDVKSSTTSIVVIYAEAICPAGLKPFCGYDFPENYLIIDKSTQTIQPLSTRPLGFNTCFRVINNLLHIHDRNSGITTLKNLTTGKCTDVSSISPITYEGRQNVLFDEILVRENDGFIEVWNWFRNIKLYSFSTKRPDGMWTRFMRKLRGDNTSRNSDWERGETPPPSCLIHASETRIVTLNRDGCIKVYGFG